MAIAYQSAASIDIPRSPTTLEFTRFACTLQRPPTQALFRTATLRYQMGSILPRTIRSSTDSASVVVIKIIALSVRA